MDFFGIEIPMTEEIRAHIDRELMIKESLMHDIQRFFNELPREHLVTLRLILHHINDDESTKLAAYYEGVVSQTLVLKYDVCGGCGINHSEIVTDETGEQKIEVEDEEDNPEPKELYGLAKITVEDFNNMQKYGLDDLRNEKTLELIGFICKNCGLQYVSIEDRMLRPVDGCGGCHLKSAHG